MRKFILMMVLALASNSAMAEFTCEKIKDKATRASCIKDRVEKEKAEAAEKEKAASEAKDKAAAAEKEKAAEAEKSKELDDFVRKAKEALTRNYKDPASAQFTNLVVGEDYMRRTLCGSVNGKNSYGGYVGNKMFSVLYYKPGPMEQFNPEIWNEGESTTKEARNSDYAPQRENALKIVSVELELFKMKCEPSALNTVTKVK